MMADRFILEISDERVKEIVLDFYSQEALKPMF
jgi:hypothetical protein